MANTKRHFEDLWAIWTDVPRATQSPALRVCAWKGDAGHMQQVDCAAVLVP